MQQIGNYWHETQLIGGKVTRGLHWFQHDLRVQDNAALSKIANQVDELLCVYVMPTKHEAFSDQFISQKNMLVGPHRAAFIEQCLADLSEQLSALNSQLLVLEGEAVSTIAELSERYDISSISYQAYCGYNERTNVQALKNALPDVNFIEGQSGLLYTQAELPFSIDDMPSTFTPFRKKVEKHLAPSLPVIELNSLPPVIEQLNNGKVPELKSNKQDLNGYKGGSAAAWQRIDSYFWQQHKVQEYKQTRNGLDGWDFSSRFSAWLAQGCISPRQIMSALKEYEKAHGANESTYWLYFELLWREFFHWRHYRDAESSFMYGGARDLNMGTAYNAKRFADWVNGDTHYPIINACMRQLKHTGFMSNRGRQLVASCLVHELQQDWRYGAKYFEYQLIDFDVAANYGNWQYLAGVGADPRGHRQFNLQKQSEIYDPTGDFIKQWQA